MDQERGRPNIVCQKSTAVITGWFARANVIIITSVTPNRLNYCVIFTVYIYKIWRQTAGHNLEGRGLTPLVYTIMVGWLVKCRSKLIHWKTDFIFKSYYYIL